MLLPSALPRVVWRAGLDLDPIDLGRDQDVAWLEDLIWPGQEARLAAFRAAVKFARRDPPYLVKRDLAADLAPLIAAVPRDAIPVVFHTAVPAYAEPLRRSAAPAPLVEQRGGRGISGNRRHGAASAGRFLLALDGKPLAWTGPHGQSLDWFALP